MNSLDQIREFVDDRVRRFLELRGDREYPEELVQEMAALGYFGWNIPAQFGGSHSDSASILDAMEELARGWLCLPSIVGSHQRVATYFLRAGTETQRHEFLPHLASGRYLWAHAYNERQTEGWRELGTVVEQRGAEWVLSGVKDWVTNAAQAHRILVLARAPDDKLAAIVVDPSRPEVRLDELPRPGMHGSSLCRVEVQNLKFSPERDRVGGPAGDVASVLASAADLKGLAFACRAVGAA